MNAIEFIANYNKYVNEIGSVLKYNLTPIYDELKARDPHDLITPETWFPSATAARGFVWNMFINAINEQSHRPITIPIDEINDLEDMELFFALLYKERIAYHPESSFRDIVNTDIHGNQTIPAFTDEESDRLDRLNERCIEIAEKEEINIFEMSMRIQRLVRGDSKKPSFPND